MNKHNVFFSFNSTTKIIILLEDTIESLDPVYQENIMFKNNKESILIADSTIYYNMQRLEEFLQKTLSNNLLLHNSITTDIGYVCNKQSYYETNDNDHIFPSGYIGWIGYLYHMWEAVSDEKRYITWMYNDHNKNIIFEITPLYPYMHCEPAEEPNYVPYEIWIKSYKPYFKTILSQEIAETWLKQAEHIIKIIEDNEAAWQRKKLEKNKSKQ